jgi:hypothetical protein
MGTWKGLKTRASRLKRIDINVSSTQMLNLTEMYDSF